MKTNTNNEVISQAIANTSWSGAEQLVKTLRRQGFKAWNDLPQLFANYEMLAANAAAAGY